LFSIFPFDLPEFPVFTKTRHKLVSDKVHCNICDQILEGLEQIDDECDVFGIHMVKIQDPQLAKRYSIKTFPALVYFRNGNPLIFEGDLQNEQSVLEWLIDDDNRELADEIEEVNERMLERLMQESPLICVFFCELPSQSF
jgi:thioredoxin-like negative regulator of GroEL